jgi:hypothetical protein
MTGPHFGAAIRALGDMGVLLPTTAALVDNKKRGPQ